MSSSLSALQADEPHGDALASRLGWLRAGVLGANDGIVSVAGIVLLVAGASSSRSAIYTAGLGGLLAGALSMALGEYVSVSSQRDSERAQIATEIAELQQYPQDELHELAALYEARGLKPDTARRVAEELTANDALRAHLEAELGIDPNSLARPGKAALASVISFLIGGILPLLAILLPTAAYRVPVTFGAVLLALAAAGALSARVGGSPTAPAVLRVVLGGGLGLGITYVVGSVFGTVA